MKLCDCCWVELNGPGGLLPENAAGVREGPLCPFCFDASAHLREWTRATVRETREDLRRIIAVPKAPVLAPGETWEMDLRREAGLVHRAIWHREQSFLDAVREVLCHTK